MLVYLDCFVLISMPQLPFKLIQYEPQEKGRGALGSEITMPVTRHKSISFQKVPFGTF